MITSMGRRELRMIVRALSDLVRGFRVLQRAGPCVTVFGSARCAPDHPYYGVGRDIGRRLTDLGFTVMTGGGPGLMEAVNRGAQDAGGRSFGCNIRLPMEQSPNRYLDRWADCEQFFIRKVLLCRYSYAFIALPGGFGTMDELFEVLTLVQTGKVEKFPIVLIGRAYWQPFVPARSRAGADHRRSRRGDAVHPAAHGGTVRVVAGNGTARLANREGIAKPARAVAVHVIVDLSNDPAKGRPWTRFFPCRFAA